MSGKEKYSGTKFETVYVEKVIPQHPYLEELKKWCAVFHDKGLAPPYPGGSYGNLSFRTQNNTFIITGTCIGLKNVLENSCFAEVTGCDPAEKKVYIKGMRSPSSESFMHHLIYSNRPDVQAVFHGHNNLITQNASLLGIPETREKVSYGTTALAESVLEILDNHNFLVIKEHGFVSMADTMAMAGKLALSWMEKSVNL